ncbi:alanyl-tRNA editing protein [Lentibacillus jeotgali]|uniref:alanyl-tRNA editing protein n=1 Tax=Lentibacillus jeotgali TaxID=558169 RepID=UPI0002627CAB|nr:DHHA1 domain-containing protein [Lentibacillus jeotgali]
MITEKLYYQDPYISFFSAQIIHSNKDEKGRFYVILDQTAFYPTGGGQPNDTGTINGAHVYNVEEENGEVRHFIDRPLEENKCYAEIDWTRRFDHMQQHAGQHILSAAYEDMYGYKTVSFHLGAENCTIDLEAPALNEEEAKRVEERANTVILENRSIETRWVTENELSKFPLRKAVSVTDNIRLVIIPDFDYNGCGGTHPNETGQVGSVKILHWEKHKKNIRVHFVCGDRVLKQLQEKHKMIQRLTATLNAPQTDLEAAANRILQKQEDLEKTITQLEAELLEQEAHKLIAQASIKDHYKLVTKIYKENSMKKLQQMANSMIHHTDGLLVLFINENDSKLQVVCARSNGIGINMQEYIRYILPEINGKGGGNEMIVQGGGDMVLSSESLMEVMIRAADKLLTS